MEITAEVVKENEALNQAYGQHFMNPETGECYVKDTEGNILLKGNDPNELNRNIANHKNGLVKMDAELHRMEVNDLKDTQEYQDLADKLNNELDRMGMVRDEETGRMMSKEDYTALQERRQAEAQVGENSGENNSKAVPEGITAEQTNGNNIDNAEIKEGQLDNSQKGGENASENKQPTEQNIIKDAAIQVHNNTVIEEAKNNLHLYQDENGKKYWAHSPCGEPVAYGEKCLEKLVQTFKQEETILAVMEKRGQTGSDIYQKMYETHQKTEQSLGIEKDDKGIYRHVEDNKANNHANGEHTKTHETQTQSKSPSWMNKLRNR